MTCQQYIVSDHCQSMQLPETSLNMLFTTLCLIFWSKFPLTSSICTPQQKESNNKGENKVTRSQKKSLNWHAAGVYKSHYSCARKFGHPCEAATLLAISPDVYNVALCQLLLR